MSVCFSFSSTLRLAARCTSQLYPPVTSNYFFFIVDYNPTNQNITLIIRFPSSPSFTTSHLSSTFSHAASSFPFLFPPYLQF